MQFFSYLLEEGEHDDLGILAKNELAIPAFISGITVNNKNKAIIAFLSLMNMYKQKP